MTGGIPLVVIGAMCAAVFALPLAQGVHTLRSPGLRLTSDGFALNSHFIRWADVETFELVGAAATHVRVHFVPAVAPSRAAKASLTLGRLGLYTAPAYIPHEAFATGGLPLEDVLRRWQSGDRTAGRPADPRPGIPPPSESLRIPLKRGPRIFVAVMSVVWFALVAVSIPLVIIDNPDVVRWLAIVMGVIAVVITAASGLGAYIAVRALWSRGLLLTDNGFTFDKHTWAWADIESFERKLVPGGEGGRVWALFAMYRQDGPAPSAPSRMPFGFTEFDTGGTDIDVILQDWLRRYRGPTPSRSPC